MVVLFVVIGCIIAGLGIALIASKVMNKNFFLWWVYGSVCLPIAVIHLLLIFLKLEKLLLFLRMLFIFYLLVLLYYSLWFLSTQPVSMIQAREVNKKFILGKTMLDDIDKITADKNNRLEVYLSQKTGLAENTVDKFITGFNNSKINNKAYVQSFALKNLLGGIYENIKVVRRRAAFYDASVPMGAASEVFDKYVKALEIINKYYSVDNEQDLYKLEDNYKTILDIQFNYFHKSDIAEEFIKHLHTQKAKAPAIFDRIKKMAADDDKDKIKKEMDRIKEIISYYEFIGDILIKDKKKKNADIAYKSAIELYNDIIESQGGINKENVILLSNIADLNSRNSDIDGFKKVLEQYITYFFEQDLYKDPINVTILKNFFRLDIIIKNKTNAKLSLEMFLGLTSKHRSKSETEIKLLENAVVESVFIKLNNKDKNKYVDFLDKNYQSLISETDLKKIGYVKSAYQFYEQNKYKKYMAKYEKVLEKQHKSLLSVKNNVINEDHKLVINNIKSGLDFVNKINSNEIKANKNNIAELEKIYSSIKADVNKINESINDIKEATKVVQDLLGEQVNNEDLDKVEADIRDTYNSFKDKAEKIISVNK